MPEYVARNVSIIDFSNPRSIRIPQIYSIQSSIIKLENRTIDIGSNCYSVREVDKNGVASKVIKNRQNIGVIRVSLVSLEENRIPLLQKLIEYMAYMARSMSQELVGNNSQRLLIFFRFYWSQSDLDYFKPENRVHYEEAAKRYSAGVAAKKKLSSWQKSKLTYLVFRFAEFIYDDEVNVFDYDVISYTRQRDGTKPQLPEEQDLALALRSVIFETSVDLLVNNKTFPSPLRVPKVCNEINDIIWLGYSPWGGPIPFPRAKDFEKYKPKEWFNRELGELVTRVQWNERDEHKTRQVATDSWHGFHKTLKSINEDYSSLKRLLAEYAGMCFVDLLMSMTGMNQQATLSLPWFGGYFIQKSSQGNKIVVLITADDQGEIDDAEDASVYLRSIKNRKGYQPVEVTIGNRFLPQFKSYLQLREYYLRGESDSRLFPFKTKLISHKRGYLHSVFPEIPKLGAQQARANLSDAVLSEANDIHIAAQVLQNAPSTVIKHYAAGTQTSHIKCVGGFFNELGSQIKVEQKAACNEIETSVGRCDNGGSNPDPLPGAPIESNCTHQEGCFFCKHYSVHADEVDIRKLVSILYYINKGATRASDVNFFNDLFELVVQRIKELLEQIEGISKEKKRLVSRIKKEVYTEEALDEYWLYKLNRFESLIGVR